ncbi:sugar diacid recognition domain-containing protein, partial [Anaerotruncus colihominis]|uniref:sugar diacid recognition domain-containing protein n=1 Tax=Anaerotruncus colihominis TaxID=169435 RepID=UPI0039957701
MSGFQLSTQSAQRIVAEIGGIVGQNINMMDAQGYIIASTDPARIGFLHEGARQIIEERLPELYIRAEEATATARTGLNLPITHRGDIVGVIGITGEYGQVIGYGQVVKKMTEILIRESTEQDDKRLDLRMRSRFLENWVLAGGPVQGQALAERGLALGIDITIPRRVMVISAQELEHYTDNMAGQKLIENVENALHLEANQV